MADKSTLQILSPSEGAVFPTDGDVVFRWPQQDIATIVLVLNAIPSTSAELNRYAIWGASFPKGAAGEARWTQGQEIKDGMWIPGSVAAPQDITLYFLVQAVLPGTLEAVSRLVPFMVGPAWVEHHPDDSCTSSGFCNSLTKPLVCYDRRCRILCASQRDCLPYGQRCSDTLTNMRICG